MKHLKFGLEGFYKIEAVKANGERRLLLDWFKNLILDAGLNRLGSGGAFDRCMVGTSAAAVSASQTGLSAQIAVTTTEQATSSGSNVVGGFAWARKTYRFPAGTATGNISEVGVGWTNTDCFSRALTVDASNNPVTITVLADEFLDVTYELRMHWPTADITASAFISSTEHTVVTRPAIVGSWSVNALISNGSRPDLSTPGQAFSFGAGALGDNTVDAGGTPLNSVNMSYAEAYVNNSLERFYRATFGLSAGDVDISNIKITTPFGQFKTSFSPVIAKRNTNTLTLDYKVSWGRQTAFVGVNPSIGNITVVTLREALSGTVSLSARIEFRSDGAIYRSSVRNGITSSIKINEWRIPNGTNVGAGFELQLEVTSGSGGTLTNNATSYLTLNNVAAIADLSESSTGAFDRTRVLTYRIRAVGGSTVLATGTVTLNVQRTIGG